MRPGGTARLAGSLPQIVSPLQTRPERPLEPASDLETAVASAAQGRRSAKRPWFNGAYGIRRLCMVVGSRLLRGPERTCPSSEVASTTKQDKLAVQPDRDER